MDCLHVKRGGFDFAATFFNVPRVRESDGVAVLTRGSCDAPRVAMGVWRSACWLVNHAVHCDELADLLLRDRG
jgi:hypothetical protein